MNETLMTACAAHGVVLNAEHVAVVEKLFDGALLKAIWALVQKDAPLLIPIMPQLLAMITAGNYLGALMLIVATLSGTPTT